MLPCSSTRTIAAGTLSSRLRASSSCARARSINAFTTATTARLMTQKKMNKSNWTNSRSPSSSYSRREEQIPRRQHRQDRGADAWPDAAEERADDDGRKEVDKGNLRPNIVADG